MMKMLIYGVGCLFLVGLGYWWGYSQCNAQSVLECDSKEMLVQMCVDTSEIIGGVREEDAVLQELFSTAFQNGDSIGVSIGRGLLAGLTAEIASNDNYGGFHVYPGMDASGNKFLIKIPLNSDGVEIVNSGSKIDLNPQNNYLGPCPKWCGNTSRVVIPNPTR